LGGSGFGFYWGGLIGGGVGTRYFFKGGKFGVYGEFGWMSANYAQIGMAIKL
jgi:hypothetical protein